MSAGASLWLLLCVSLCSPLAAATAAPRDWGDWIIVDETEPGTSILLRRITPKSVFVAPTFTGCSEGYRQDALGRCVKLVKVNQQAQWNFFLERLNSMYAPSSTSKNPQKEAGPFHISLPIGTENPREDVNVKKRVPPTVSASTTTTTTPSTTIPTTVTTTQLPTTTVESTTEAERPVTWRSEKDERVGGESSPQPETTTSEARREPTTEDRFDVMMGDQPVTTEDFVEAERFDTPKKYKETPTQLPAKPFVIIVTDETTSRTEDTTTNLPTSVLPPVAEEDADGNVSETPSTTEVTTESTTDTNSRYTTEATPSTTEYDDNFSATTDFDHPVRVQYVALPTIRPKCDQARVMYGSFDLSDCSPAGPENMAVEREVKRPSDSVAANQQLQMHVRFPTEPAPAASQAYVRFPADGHDYWRPAWQLRRRPDKFSSSRWSPVHQGWISYQRHQTHAPSPAASADLFPSRRSYSYRDVLK